jgi:sugar/nucleoside kinase (ribokinase family)
MDVLVEVTDDFLDKHNLRKGSMHLVTPDSAQSQLDEVKSLVVRTLPGGSSANTARGVSALGGSSAFFGAVGSEIYGSMYKGAMDRAGVSTHLYKSDTLTGFAITYITPDHERTFVVHLGAASEVPTSVIDMRVLESSKVIHLEAFQFEGYTKSTLEQVVREVQQYNTKVSLDLNDAALIERNLSFFNEIVTNYVDILFLNEKEAESFTEQSDPKKIIKALQVASDLVIYKCGSDGAQIITQEEVITVAAKSVEVVDTTGAGDLFAAGFLKGITAGQTYADAGSLGAKAAATIITEVGVVIEENFADKVAKIA